MCTACTFIPAGQGHTRTLQYRHGANMHCKNSLMHTRSLMEIDHNAHSHKKQTNKQKTLSCIRERFCTQGVVGDWDRLPRTVVRALSCWSSRSVWTTLSDIWFVFGWSCMEPGVGLDEMCGSLPTLTFCGSLYTITMW